MNEDEDLDELPNGPTGGALVWPVLITITLAVLCLAAYLGIPWF